MLASPLRGLWPCRACSPAPPPALPLPPWFTSQQSRANRQSLRMVRHRGRERHVCQLAPSYSGRKLAPSSRPACTRQRAGRGQGGGRGARQGRRVNTGELLLACRSHSSGSGGSGGWAPASQTCRVKLRGAAHALPRAVFYCIVSTHLGAGAGLAGEGEADQLGEPQAAAEGSHSCVAARQRRLTLRLESRFQRRMKPHALNGLPVRLLLLDSVRCC